VVGRIFDRLDYPSQNLRHFIPYVGRCDFRGYTSTLLTESRVYNSPSYRDHSLRRKAKFLLNHEERRAYQNKYNVVGVTFITCFAISWQAVLLARSAAYSQFDGVVS